MLKNLIRNLLQKLLGFDRYVFFFSIIHITRIRWGLSEKAFRYFVNMIPEDGVVLDIGANIGSMTVVIALTHPGTTVYSFEPIPGSRKALERVIHFYGLKNVKVFAHALGNDNGMVEMVMPYAGGARMQGLSHIVEAGTELPGERYSIPIQKLDDIEVLQSAERISAIKIDVENFEYFVLKGGMRLLEKHRPLIFCELWDTERRGLCFDLMGQLGYRVKVFQDGSLLDFTGKQALDFFFLP